VATWVLDLQNRIGTGMVQAAVGFERLTARWVLNGAGSLEVDLNVNADVGGGRPGQTEWQLKRDGTVVFAGPWNGTDVDPRGRKLRATADGLWWWFRRRVVDEDLVYTAVDQQDIAWALLAHTQAQTYGSLGITQGAHTGADVARDRFYCEPERANVAEAVEAFTEYDDGFDFEVDPAARTFKTWTPYRMAASGLTLDGDNVDELTYTEDVRDMLTFVTGIGSDDCGPIIVDVSATSIADDYGRRQAGVDTDDDDSTQITSVANELLRAEKRPRFDAKVIFRDDAPASPAWADLVVGNTLTLEDDRGYATFSETLRIVERAVTLDNALPNVAFIELTLSSAVAA
jgi:hypothetical protein